jgi:putative ABC transport system permease protein
MRNVGQILRFSHRRLRNKPGVTTVVLLTLALGVGANTAMFTVDYASMIAPIPYPNPDQLVIVWSKVNGYRTETSPADFLEWRHLSSSFQALDATTFGPNFNVATRDQPEFFAGWSSTAGMFQRRGLRFSLGRDFLPEEEAAGKNHVVVLSHRLWKRLGSDPNILGKAVRFDNVPYTVVGVWAEGTGEEKGTRWFDVPLSFKPEQINHDDHWLVVEGRLKPGVTIQQAQSDIDRVTAILAKEYPDSNKGWGASVEFLKSDFFSRDTQFTCWLLLGAVTFVLLIACVNVANILLAKGVSGQKEIAVRIALGASRTTIFAQQIVESQVLALAGGALGVGVAYAILCGIASFMPVNYLPLEADLRLNIPILCFTLASTTLAGLLFGCAPAWYASRVDPGENLKEAGRSGVGKGHHRFRRVLVVGEFALALSLLAGAGLAIHSFLNLQRVELGFRTDHILKFWLAPPESKLKDPDSMNAYYQQMLDNISGLPGVARTTATTVVPLEGSEHVRFTIAGRADIVDPKERPWADLKSVTSDYFSTFGIPIVSGRSFGPDDTASTLKVAMVNEEFVKRYFKAADPRGQRLSMSLRGPGIEKAGPLVEWQIVGVFRNVRNWDLTRYDPAIVLPFLQNPSPQASIVVRTWRDPAEMIKAVAAGVHRVDPDIGLGYPRTMDQVREESLAENSFNTLLFASFAGMALLLAAVGIYGVMAFSVAQRSHEIAVRIALGAGRDGVLKLVLCEGLLLAAIGLGLGLCGSYFIGRMMQSLLFGVHAFDSAAFSTVGLVLLLTALLASFLPARRAASLEPMQALRRE